MNDKTSAQRGAMGGMLLSIGASIDSGDWMKSCLLAATGTIVSFILSRIMKALFERRGDIK
jgi:hypothetical protein